jgi:hypothetical protein
VRTTIPAKDGKRAGDLLDRDSTASAPSRVWVSDFSYVRAWTGWVHVAFILDVFPQRIVAWHAAPPTRAVAIPKSAEGTAEMIRQVKIARDTARKARTSAIVTLKALIVTVPGQLREQLSGLSDKVLIDTCAALRPGAVSSPTDSAKHALRTLARRYQVLAAEIGVHDTRSWTTSPAATHRR